MSIGKFSWWILRNNNMKEHFKHIQLRHVHMKKSSKNSKNVQNRKWLCPTGQDSLPKSQPIPSLGKMLSLSHCLGTIRACLSLCPSGQENPVPLETLDQMVPSHWFYQLPPHGEYIHQYIDFPNEHPYFTLVKTFIIFLNSNNNRINFS